MYFLKYVRKCMHLYLDFGTWANLDELNMGTNQLSVLPGYLF